MEEELYLECSCPKCIGPDPVPEHRHLVKDYHPEIPWNDNSKANKQLLHQLQKTWGAETGMKKFKSGNY